VDLPPPHCRIPPLASRSSFRKDAGSSALGRGRRWLRLQQDTVNAAEMIDTIGFHAISFDIRDPVLRDLPH
jgi:hypothetical protein